MHACGRRVERWAGARETGACRFEHDEDLNDEDDHRGEESHVESFKELGKLFLVDRLTNLFQQARLAETECDEADEPEHCQLGEEGVDDR